ncbi:MAG: TIGR01906 family membrane protein [Candidatus Buchananbacteria bacterium]|nr:TIGR01906 family membrane protein [Candidatus Buchananbacteria bacterium]
MLIVKILVITTFITFILLASIDASIFDSRWYEKQFTKNNIYQTLDAKRVTDQTENLFSYLKNENSLDSQYYTNREVTHLTDIKNIINILQITTFISLAGLVSGLLLIYQREKKAALIKILSIAAVTAIVFYTSLGLLITYNFDQFFSILHQLSFRNDFWLLDPTTENLINIFPPNLFAALGSTIIAKAILASLITLILARLWLLKSNKKG